MNDDGDDEMPFFVQKGYDQGMKFMEGLTTAKVYDLKGNWIPSKMELKALPKGSEELRKGFNGAVHDFLQDKELDWLDIFGDRLAFFHETQ